MTMTATMIKTMKIFGSFRFGATGVISGPDGPDGTGSPCGSADCILASSQLRRYGHFSYTSILEHAFHPGPCVAHIRAPASMALVRSVKTRRDALSLQLVSVSAPGMRRVMDRVVISEQEEGPPATGFERRHPVLSYL